jgi:hypothetical protein
MWVAKGKMQNEFRSTVQKSTWKGPLGRIGEWEDNSMMALMDSLLTTITRLKRLHAKETQES